MRQALKIEFSVKEKGRNVPTYKLESDANGELTLIDFFKFSQNALINIFDTVLKEEQSFGFTTKPRTRVDGSFFKPVVNVMPFGKIQAFDKQNVLEILDDIYNSLIDRSRIESGNYVKSHVVFFNGNLIAASINQLESWVATNQSKNFKSGDTFDFINLSPYARKLERRGLSFSANTGKNSSKQRTGKGAKGQTIAKPNGAYYKTSRSIKRKFKDASGKIAFKWRTAPRQAKAFNSGRVGPSGVPFRTNFYKNGGVGRPYVYPSIQYKIDNRGILQ